MCWINWFVNLKDQINILNKMNRSIKYRWPNDNWVFCDDLNNIWIWQVRLSVIDLSNAWHQPMFYNKHFWASSKKFNSRNIIKSDLCITFNWEIYNYKKIKKELVSLWYTFSTNTDTEIILASYQEWWNKCVEKFNWMWAFSIFDKEKNILFCSRDRMWKKPFFYYSKNSTFIFSSEIKSILSTWVKKEIDNDSLSYYLVYWYIPEPKSIFNNIKKLEAWSNLIFNIKYNKIDNIYKYYKTDLTNKQNNFSFEKNKEIVKEKLENAIEYRLVWDVKIWVLLSGWIDSSLIATIAKKKFWTKNLHTFSVWFDIKSYDETHYAKIVADKIWSTHHNYVLTQKEAFKILNELPKYFDEPFADSSMIPFFAVSREARKYVTVVLSWDWADELFWWYLNFVLYYYLLTINKYFPKPISCIFIIFWKLLTNILKPANNQKLKWLALWLKSLEFLKYNKKYELFAQINSNHAYINKDKLVYFEKYFKKENSWKNNSMNSFLNTHLINDFFVKVDRSSMANSLEVRSPFMDRDLVDFSNTIPDNYKIKITKWYKYNLKYILKEAWKDYLPKEIYNRWKQWFTLPIAVYFQNEWKWFLNTKIEKLTNRNLLPISKKDIEKILTDHDKWKYDYFWFIYSLLFLELWFEQWID